jgi:hypothetical protein
MQAVVTSAAKAVLVAMTLVVCVSADSSVTLTVRLYNTSGIPTPQLLAARHAAESILRHTGLDVRFRQCGRLVSPGNPVDLCDDLLKPSEVVVRVIDAPSVTASPQPDAYGVSYVVKETNHGWLATVFSDRIDRAATRVGVESGTLLGRVIAHEVGHLLLGSGYHGEAGVMRAEWPDALLSRKGDEWHFSMLEAARMQLVLASIVGHPCENETAIGPLPTDSIPHPITF